jgi:hypothetical protein
MSTAGVRIALQAELSSGGDGTWPLGDGVACQNPQECALVSRQD